MKVLTLLLCLCLPGAWAQAQTTAAEVLAGATDTVINTVSASAATPLPATTEKKPAPTYAKKLRHDVDTVFASDDFHQRTEITAPVLRPWLKKWLDSFKPAKPDDAPAPLLPNFSGLAQILKYLLVVVLGLALLWLLWRGWKWLAPQIRQRAQTARPVTVTEAQSRALSAEALPDTIITLARQAWKKGDAGTALSLLYRGALRSLENTHQLSLPASATEGECLRLARRSGKAVVSEGFAPIVGAWMALAYAGRLPDDFEKLAVLYTLHFDKAHFEHPLPVNTTRRAG